MTGLVGTASGDLRQTPPESTVGARVRRLQSLLCSHWLKWFRARGLAVTPVQGGVLLMIRRHSGLSQIMLARLMRIEAPTLLQTLTPLLEQGLVARARSALDARVFELTLTPAGLEAARVIEYAAPEHEVDALRGLTAEERALLLTLLDRAIAGAEEAMTDRELPGAA